MKNKVLVLGASGATGRLLVEELLKRKMEVIIIVRPDSSLPDNWKSHEKVIVIQGEISSMSKEELSSHLSDCDAAASCLGHNISIKGILGKPRRLVTDAVKLVYMAVKNEQRSRPFRFVLMNTVGNRNRDLEEYISLLEKMVMSIIRTLIPPQKDNEMAADFLRTATTKGEKQFEWSAVRPDSLIDLKEVGPYSLFPSPQRSALFDPGKTSRINVADFMAALLTEDDPWNQWKGRMPVIYNLDSVAQN